MASTLVFLVFALAACGGAVAVAVTQNVVRMAFWLVLSLGATAGLFFMAGADFVGATQLLIYVGGTVVLLIFGVMLTASGPYLSIKSSPGELVQSAAIGAAFLAMIWLTVMQVDWDQVASRQEAMATQATFYDRPGYNTQAEGSTVRSLGAALLGARFDQDLRTSDKELSTGYLLPFEIISIHLLVVLVGAAYLARAKRRRRPSDAA